MHAAGVPEETAVDIALGAVATGAETALIDACAACREQDLQVQHHASTTCVTLFTRWHHLPLTLMSSGSDNTRWKC